MQGEEKKKVHDLFKRLLKLRLPKIAKKVFVVGSMKDLTKWERVLAKKLLQIGETWYVLTPCS